MWILLVLAAALAGVAVSRSPREAPTRRQLMLGAAPPPPPPGPIAVLGEMVQRGLAPPPTVILCAIAEAEAIGRDDLASDIIRVFVAPVVQQHAWVPSVPYTYTAPAASAPPRRTIPAAFVRESCAVAPPLSRSPRSAADAARVPPPPAAFAPQRAPLGLGQRSASDDEIRAMLNADPEGFIALATRGLSAIEVPIEVVRPAIIHEMSARAMAIPAPDPVAPTISKADALADQITAGLEQLAAVRERGEIERLLALPGHAGTGVVLDPATGSEDFEVRWLRGYPIPSLPPTIDGRAVRLVLADELPMLQEPTGLGRSELPQGLGRSELPQGLPPEMVAELQEAAGLHDAADQTRALAPGSPIAGVPDDAWREFVMRLERESSKFSSQRHIGQYRQCRDRLAELGIDPKALADSAQAQRGALDVDLVDAHRHATDGGLIADHVGRAVALPGREATVKITLSGVLGVIQCAGLDGAAGWLEKPGDRKRFPYTTQVFLRTNGSF